MIKFCKKCQKETVFMENQKVKKPDGTVAVYTRCMECNRNHARSYYKRFPEKVLLGNLKSLAKRFGYKLKKL